MSAILSAQLPAAVVAAAFATTTQPAPAAVWTATDDALQGAHEIDEGQNAELLRWVRGTPGDCHSAATNGARIDETIAGHHAHARAGIGLLDVWAKARAAELAGLAETAWREARTALVLSNRIHSVAADTSYAAADAVASAMAKAGDMTTAWLAGRDLQVFTLRAAATPTAPVRIRALVQPLYDIYQQVLRIEATLRLDTDWAQLNGLLDRAVRGAAQDAVIAARIESLSGAVQAVEAASVSAARVMQVTKAEFLRIASEAARIALSDVPKQEARLAGETPAPIAAVSGGAPRTFGRRIDYRALADHWVGRR